jgi:ankyrin repeat protein
MAGTNNSDLETDSLSESLSSLLLIAAKKGHSGAVRALLKSCADHSVQDSDGNTPLLLSVSTGDAHSVKSLLRSGASLNKINHFGEGIISVSGLLD